MIWWITLTALLGGVGGLNLLTDVAVDRAEEAFPDSGRFVIVGEASQHYFELGMENDTVLVLLHGVGGSSYGWLKRGILDSLARDYHVYAFDRAGHGHSQRPEGMGGDPRSQAAVLHRALQTLEVDRPVIIGLSWGGAVAAAYAVHYPDDLSALILLAPYILPNERAVDILYPVATVPGVSDALLHTLAVPVSSIIRTPLTRRTFSPEAIPEDYWGETILLSQRPEAIQTMAVDMRAVNDAVGELSNHYGAIHVPVSVLIGAHDVYFADDPLPVWTDSLEWIYEEIPGAGHGLQYTQAEKMVRFIRQNVRGD